MREYELRFLTNDVVTQINVLVDAFAAAGGKQTPAQLLELVTALLKIERTKPDSVRRRVEGYYYAAEFLFKRLLAGGRTRNQIVKDAQLKPLHQYHYTEGSREPANLLLTRDDYLNDSGIALTKLKDDINALGELVIKSMK